MVRANYTRRGVYHIRASVRNMVEFVDWNSNPTTLEKRVLITGGPCAKPIVNVQAVPFSLRSRMLDIPASFQLNCSASFTITQNWTAEFSENANSTDWRDVTRTIIPRGLRNNFHTEKRGAPILHDISLSYEKKTLDLGFYRFTLWVDMPEEELLDRRIQFVTEIRRTPLVARFRPISGYVDGVYGKDKPHRIDAFSLTYDPDFEEVDALNATSNTTSRTTSTFVIKYYCKRVCEGPWPELNSYDTAKAFVDNPQSWVPRACTAPNQELKDLGYEESGCLNYGWHGKQDLAFPYPDAELSPAVNLPILMRKLRTRDPETGVMRDYNMTAYFRSADGKTVVFDTSRMYENETFNMLAVVLDRPTKRFALASQAVRLEKGDPPTGTIKTLANCGFPYQQGCLMNPTSRTTFRRTIDNRIIGRVYRYTWYLIQMPAAEFFRYLDLISEAFEQPGGLMGMETLKNWTNLTSTGRYGPDLSFDGNAFDSSYFGKIFAVINEARLGGEGRIGRSMVFMYIDNPPNATAASCRTSPSSGVAMTTAFSIRCQGFTDLDDAVLKKFTFVAYTCPTCDPLYITPIPQVAPELTQALLPAGNPNDNFTLIIRVYSYDSVDAIAFVDTFVTVQARNDLEYIQQQYKKLSEIAIRSTPDLLVNQLLGFTNILNSRNVTLPYQGNFTLIDSETEEESKKKAEIAKINKDYDRYQKEMKSMRQMRMDSITWLKTVGVASKNIQSIKSYCGLISMVQAVPSQAISLEFQKMILSIVRPAINILANYSLDKTIDPTDLDAASSSCVNALGKLAEAIEFAAKYVTPPNPTSSISTTTPSEFDLYYNSKTTTLSPEVRTMLTELDAMQEEIMVIILSCKGVQESRSVIGGSSSKMSLSADFVGNLNNANLASGADEDCGNFQLGDASTLFGPSVSSFMAADGVKGNNTEVFNAVKIQLKAKMERGNSHSSVQKTERDLNSMVQTLVMVDDAGREVIVKNLTQPIEIMIESQNPNKPNVLTTAALGFSLARTMKPINLPASKDSAVFVVVDQLYDLSETELAGNASCNVTFDSFCKDPYSNVTINVGSRNMTVAEINATKEEVAIFVFINRNGLFPKDTISKDDLACILPRESIDDEIWTIATGISKNANSTTTTRAPLSTTRTPILTTTTPGRFVTTTTARRVTTTRPPTSTSPKSTAIIGPAQKNCKKNKILPSNTCFFKEEDLQIKNTTTLLYVGVRAIPMSLIRPVLQQLYKDHGFKINESMIIKAVMEKLVNNTVSALIRYKSYAANCIFWDPEASDWSSDGCKVGPLTTAGGNPSLTQCFCNHLTTFGSNFDIPMNTFNPSDSAFSKLDQNPVCFTFGICIFCLYFTILIWARKKDREDERKWGSLPLLDNDPRDKYAYEVSIWTGQRKGAGTTARVSFILTGDEGETAPRMLDDFERPILKRAQVDSFLMTVPRSLGKVSQLRIWHDNSGKHPAWYFARMMVYDIQRNRQYFFLCDRWLAVEEDDGMVERICPIAGRHELSAFEHQFFTKSQRKLTDGHLWVSVFSRPPRSAFTRTQRLTCCLTVLYCTMLSNIMFFGAPESPDALKYKLGPINLSSDKLKISIISTAVVLPMNLLIVQLFRMSKRRMTENERKMNAFIEKTLKAQQLEIRRQAEKSSALYGVSYEKPKKPKRKSKKEKKQPFKLPWWCAIIAYCLAAASCGVAFWAIVEYGGMLGPDGAIEWVQAMITSLITDILFVQPGKILVVALFYALIIKNPTKDEDIEEHMMLRSDETYIRPQELSKSEKDEVERLKKDAQARRQEYVFMPPDPEELKLARDIRLKEIAMWKIIKEIASYIIFLYMVMFVAYNNVDEWSWRMQQSARLMIFEGSIGDLAAPAFSRGTGKKAIKVDVESGEGAIWSVAYHEKFWFYLNHTVIPTLFDSTWYTGDPDDQPGSFTKDKAVYLAGTLRLRQLRIGADSCRIPARFRRLIYTCGDDYSVLKQEDRNFTLGWAPAPRYMQDPNDPNGTITYNQWTSLYPGWNYQSTLKTGSSPTSGDQALYDGGGYVVDMPKNVESSRTFLGQLYEYRWLDDKTRAVFIEFNLFSPSRGLFGVSQTILEFPASGGILLRPYFYILKIQSYSTSGEMITLAIQAVTLLIVLILFFRECNRARSEGRTYWKAWWSVFDFTHLLSCLIWSCMFAARYFAFSVVAGRFKKRTNTYTNMDLIVLYDLIVSAFAALIVAAGTLRFIRLLRFDRSVMIMLQTLKNCQKFLTGYFLVFFAIFLAFTQWAFLAFGQQIGSYATFIGALETLFAMQLGVYDYVSLRSIFPTLGPIFFMFYSLIISIVLTNFLVAFIVYAYQEAYTDDSLRQEERAVFSFMFDRFKKTLGLIDRRPPSLGIDKRFMYLQEVVHEDEIDRFTTRMEELMDKLDKHLEKTKVQFSGMFDQRTLKRNLKEVYVTD